MRSITKIFALVIATILPFVWLIGCEDPDYYTAGLQFELYEFEGYEEGDEYAVVGYDGYDMNVVIPSVYGGLPVTVIDYMAFKDCVHIESVSIPNSVKRIDNLAFWNCQSLEEIKFPKSLEALGSDSLYGCNLIKYEVHKGLKYIGNEGNGQAYMVGITSDYLEVAEISDKCKLIAEGVFSNSSYLKKVYIPQSVLYISGPLEGWNEYEELTFYCEVDSKPEGWTSIWNRAGRGEYPVYWGYNG